MSHFEKNKGPRAGSTQATWYTSQGRILPICSMDLWLDPGVVMPLTLGNQTFSTQSWKEISRFCPVDPTLMQNSSKQWDLEVQMGVITNLCPFSNLCQSLLYLFQGFLSETFCQTWGSWADAWFPLWMAASKCSHNQLSPQTTGQPSMAYSNNFSHAGWWQVHGLDHIQPLKVLLYLLWTVLYASSGFLSASNVMLWTCQQLGFSMFLFWFTVAIVFSIPSIGGLVLLVGLPQSFTACFFAVVQFLVVWFVSNYW